MASTISEKAPQKAAPVNFLSRVKESLSRSLNGESNDENQTQDTEAVALDSASKQSLSEAASPLADDTDDSAAVTLLDAETQNLKAEPLEEDDIKEEEVVITSDAPLKENVRRERSVGTWNRVEVPSARDRAVNADVIVAPYEAAVPVSSLPTLSAQEEEPQGEVYGNEVLENIRTQDEAQSSEIAPIAPSTFDIAEPILETDESANVVMVTPVQAVTIAEADDEPHEEVANLSEVAQLLLLEISMATLNESLNNLMKIDGAMAVALVDSSSGMSMGTAGGGPLDLDVAAAGNSEVVKAKLKVMKALALDDKIEDILITLGEQYHLIRPLKSAPEVFVYLVLNRASANLAMARHKLASSEKDLEI